MTKNMKCKAVILLVVFFTLTLSRLGSAFADTENNSSNSNFDFTLRAGALTVNFTDSDLRRSVNQVDESLDVIYKKYYGVNVGAKITRYDFVGDAKQLFIVSNYGKIFGSFGSDLLRGRLGGRLGSINTQGFTGDQSGAVTENNAVTSNNIRVLTGVFYYQSNSGINLDYGQFSSRYYDSVDFSPIDVNQQNFTIGFTFNSDYDWIQYRSTIIDIDSTDIKRFTSEKIQYSHWFQRDQGKSVLSAHLSVLTGRRQYGVEEEGSIVYNFADIQLDSYSAGLIWKPDKVNVSLFAGKEIYEKRDSSDQYSATFIYLAVGKAW